MTFSVPSRPMATTVTHDTATQPHACSPNDPIDSFPHSSLVHSTLTFPAPIFSPSSAQCVDCAPDKFGADCQYWSEDLLEAAEDLCGISNCTKPAPPTAECATDDDCDGETNDCIVQADGLWAQCIDCAMNQTEFCNEEPFWCVA